MSINATNLDSLPDVLPESSALETIDSLLLERKNAELEEAQRLSHIGSWEWDIKANKINWTTELYRIYGVEKSTFDATYENFLSLVHPDDRDKVNSEIHKAFEESKRFEFEHRIVRPDGGSRILLGRGEIIFNEDGEAVLMRGTGQDITEQKATEKKLRELNQTYNFAEQTTGIGSFRYNLSTRRYTYSDNLFRILGCEPGEFEPASENFLSFVHADDVNDLVGKWGQLEKTLVPADEVRYRIVRKNGEIIHVRNTGVLIQEGEDKVYIGTVQDVTWLYNSEQQLMAKNKALEKMNEELDSFTYIASHDLQEPLRKIQMFSKRIAEVDYDRLSADGKNYFDRIENAVVRMQQLIDDLLDYSKTKAQRLSFEKKSVHVLLQEVIDSLREKINTTGTTIETNVSGEIALIPFQFKQLLTNLIANSIKFAQPGKAAFIKLTDSLIVADKNNQVAGIEAKKYYHLKIEDNGIGFDQQFNKQIFGLFQRLHSRVEYAGTGIGLAICKKIVDNHNGVIEAEGFPNQGSVFNIYIPVEG